MSPGQIHSVSTNNPNESFDIAEFENLQNKANEKGVKLAILDLSCYSGQSLDIAKTNSNVCVITAASRETVGYLGFTEKLFENLQSGRSLEESFLISRQGVMGWPQISTPQGLFAESALKDLHNQVTSNIDDLFVMNPTTGATLRCLSSEQIRHRTLGAISRKTQALDETVVADYTKAVQEYVKKRDSHLEDLNYGSQHITLPNGEKVSHSSLINQEQYFAFAREMIQVLHLESDKERYLKELKKEDMYKTERQRLIDTDKKFKQFYENNGKLNLTESTQDLRKLSARISASEKQLYETAYEAAAKYGPGPRIGSDGKGGNACQDFKF